MNAHSINASSAQQHYNPVTRFFHWAVLALLVAEFPIAWTMPEVHKDTRPDGLISWHIFFGTLILAVMFLRIFWRLSHRAPPDVPMPRWQTLAANATHQLLYAGLVILPLMGWANASSRGWNVKFLGFIPLPALSPRGSSWGHELGDVHQAVAIGLLVVIGLHAAAAVYHQWVIRDNLLQRMLPPKP
ncbi:MAG: cytochrome b [Burkholderiales bacterium]|nr:cytochrome b [Ferrovum sp.]